MTQEQLQSLIPETKEFDWIDDLTPLGWLQHAGSVGQAIAYVDLFWPDFIEHDGCILRADHFSEDTYRKWLKSTDGNRDAVEAVMNHTHLTDLFPYQKYESTHEQLIKLGYSLKGMWQTKLDRDFPGRCYVSLFQDGQTLDSIQITVKSLRTRQGQ
jgi:hypothetical protein